MRFQFQSKRVCPTTTESNSIVLPPMHATVSQCVYFCICLKCDTGFWRTDLPCSIYLVWTKTLISDSYSLCWELIICLKCNEWAWAQYINTINYSRMAMWAVFIRFSIIWMPIAASIFTEWTRTKKKHRTDTYQRRFDSICLLDRWIESEIATESKPSNGQRNACFI